MRHALLALALVVLAAPLAATAERAAPGKVAGTVLAVESSRGGDYLVRVDAASLRRVSKRVSLGGRASGWSLSPDGQRLALGVDRLRGVAILDLRRMKRTMRIRTWSMRERSTLVWATSRRIIGWEPAGPFVLDTVTGKAVATPRLPGEVLAASRAGNRLVLLTASHTEIGPAELAVVDAAGRLRTVRLDRVRAGTRIPINSDAGERHHPALVIDPAGRAIVVGGRDEPVAEIDLGRLEVRYQSLQRRRSLLARLWSWLEPAANAKMPLAGSFRAGLWLGDGKIAVWGYDSAPAGPEQIETKTAGVAVVDTSDWTIQTVDARAWGAAFAGETLLTWGEERGGLAGFSMSGERRYRLYDGEPVGVVATFDSRAVVAFERKPMEILEAPTGDVLGTMRSVPRLLHPSYSGSP